MHTQTLELLSGSPGIRQSLQVLRFGTPGARPKVYIQSALHADEVPAILVAHQLVQLLSQAEALGRIAGEVVLVPFANPIGLGQHLFGQHQGRFDMRDGGNFNRGYAELAAKVLDRVRPSLTQDMANNTGCIRKALVQAVGELTAVTPTQDLKTKLLSLAVDADVVLDLHCDTDAVMHVYALTPQAAIAEELGAALGARAVLLATESGDSPFDEACTRPWFELQKLLPEFPVDLACFGATVELRGEADTSHILAEQDAQGLCAFLARRGVLTGGADTPRAPHAGVVVFHRNPGERVVAGDVIADVVDALTGNVTQLRCKSDGLLYARCGSRWAVPGKRLAKIAGTSLARTGKLLSP
jgi:hypothetical protein